MKKMILFSLIINGGIAQAQLTEDFEAPLNPSYWETNGSITGSTTLANPHSGYGMLSFEGIGSKYISVGVSLSPGSPHFIGVWVSSAEDMQWAAGDIEISLNTLNDNDYIIGSTELISATSSWEYVEVSFSANYNGNYLITFQPRFVHDIYNPWYEADTYDYSGDGYLDDIVIDTESHISNVSVNELSSHDFKLYPNPSTNNKFNITFSHAIDDVNIELFDAIGKQVYSEKTSVFSNTNKEINVAHLAKGIYTCKISNSTGYTVKKIILE